MQKFYKIINYKGINVVEIQEIKFDLFEIPKISKIIDEDMKKMKYPSCIIDLNKIQHIDSTGFGFLISMKNNIQKHGSESVVVCNIENILHIIQILNMERFLKIFKSLDEAVDYFNSIKSTL